MNLLSSNDYKAIQKAFDELKELRMTRTLHDYRLTVEVQHLGKTAGVWGQQMVITVSQEYANIFKTKNCRDVAEVRWYLST